MKLERLWEEYQYQTRDITENARKLAFAVAAICWFFKTPNATFPPATLWSLSLLVCFFFCDVMQYVTGAIVLRLFLEHKERKQYLKTGHLPDEVTKPRWVDYPGTVFFAGKVLFLLGSFAALGTEFYYRIFVVHTH